MSTLDPERPGSKTQPALLTKGEIMKTLYVQILIITAFLMTYVAPVLADGGGGM
jgi:hypothetical protein